MTTVEAADPEFAPVMELYKRGVYVEALQLSRNLIAAQPRKIAPKMSMMRHLMAMRSAMRAADWVSAEEVARDTVARHPAYPLGHRILGEALLRQGAPTEAVAPLLRSLELDPQQDEARTLLEAAQAGGLAKPARVRAWPASMKSYADPEAMIRRHLLRHLPSGGFVRPEARFMTMGSCFASNLARRLQSAGYEAAYEDIGEEINSTYANRYMLEWLEGGPLSPQAEAIRTALGDAMGERLRASLAQTDVFVLTLGVAPCFFDGDTGQFVYRMLKSHTAHQELYARTVMRTTTVAENVANLIDIVARIRRMARPGLKIVTTISPVPLAGTTEFESVVMADSLSKSTLLVACHEALAQLGPDIFYWPSFEMVRWLGAYFPNAPVYGADDGNSRHVSSWLVDTIIRLFLEHHAAPDTAT